MKKGSAAFQQHVYTADKEFCQEMQYILTNKKYTNAQTNQLQLMEYKTTSWTSHEVM